MEQNKQKKINQMLHSILEGGEFWYSCMIYPA